MTNTTLAERQECPAHEARRRLNRLFFGIDSPRRLSPCETNGWRYSDLAPSRDLTDDELAAWLAEMRPRVARLLQRAQPVPA